MGVYFLVVAFSYLIGSIPFSYFIARACKGVDIRKTGSGNVGATNVWRTAGPAAGAAALAADAAKGVAAVVLARSTGGPDLVALAAAAVLAGHSWPVFLGFRGGKMIATAAGAVLAISPKTLCAVLAVWLLVLAAGRYVSVSSVAAAVSLPVFMALFKLERPYIWLGVFAAVFAVIKHIPNIRRLAAGTEPKVGRRKQN